MTRCPSSELLQQLLADRLSGPEAEALEAHVEVCSSCQQVLEEWTGGATETRGGEPPALEESGAAFLRRLEGECAAVGRADPVGVAALPSLSSSRRPEAATDPPAVPGYEILGELGRGGMGVVYKARQKSLNRLVALKMVLVGERATAERLARFKNEAEALARLQHPNIVQVHEVGEHAGRPFFCLEFVDGSSLAQRLAGVPQPPRPAAEVVAALARAMGCAHRQGILHRDLKPANILLAADGTPKVTDFGLAKRLDDGAGWTQSGVILGTPGYMAPEQAGGHAGGLGPAVDVYALGAILYECLTGRPPFQAATVLETVELVRSAEPVPPSRLQLKVPRDLETICLKCLEKEPARRYAAAHDLAEDLRRFLSHEPIRARRTGPLGRAGRWCRRKPAVAALLACVGVLAVATVAISVVSAWRLGAEARRAQQAERDATEKLFKSAFTRAQALRKSGEMGQRFESLAALEEAVGIARSLGVLDEHTLALRNEVVACLALADLRVVQEWDAPAHWDSRRFDAGLERYACADEDGDIRIFRVADRQEIARLPGPGAKVRFVDQQFSADGRFLAVTYWFAGPQPPQFVLWELRDTGPVRRLGPAENTALSAFSADGRRLAVAQPDGSITLHDLASGDQRRLGPDLSASSMAFRPDGQQLAFARHPDNTEVRILDLKRNQVVRSLSHPDDVRRLAWSADGRLLAAGCDDRNVHVWDTEQGKQQAILEGHQMAVCDVAFSPAGNLLASSAGDETSRVWDPVSGRQLLVAPGKVQHFSPDGQRLAFDRGSRLGVWEVADGRECAVLHHGRVGNRAPWLNSRGPEMVHFRSDGRLLASAAADGVRLWDAPSRREVAFLNAGHHEAALFHPDGSRLYTFGRTGLRCWPVRSDDRGPGSLRVGPPELLGPTTVQAWFRGGRDGDGRLLAAAEHLDDRRDRLLVFPAEQPAARTVLGDDFKLARIAVSPDGRWVAAGQFEPAVGIKVWDAQTGRLAWSSACDRIYVTFSPDGAWLLAGGGRDYGLWKVGSWEPGPVIPKTYTTWRAGFPAFRPDGRVLAVSRSLQHVQLLDFATRQELATLAAPDLPCIDNWFGFGPDGRLLAVATESHSIQLWDLGAIGRQLRALGLGCDLLPESPDEPLPGAPPRVRVFQEVYEAEYLKIVDTSVQTAVQDMRRGGREHWSNDKHLLCATPKGGFVELQADVPETGRYRLAVCFTHAGDFGVIETALDGRKTGGLFDGWWENGTLSTEKIEYGTFELREGPHRLRFTAVDKNPKSADYHIAIDYVQLTPAEATGAPTPGAADRPNPEPD
jgi:WD40 repeat protein/tRNA A-37 threonylcarbamoyl transferase component Bud32